MKNLSERSKKSFLKFFSGELSPTAFASWIYSTENLEDELGAEYFFDLIDLDFRKISDVEKARNKVAELYNAEMENAIIYDLVESVLNRMLAGTLPFSLGCKTLADLNVNGFDFIPDVFIGYSSEMLDEKSIEFYKDRISGDAQLLLLKLKENRNERSRKLDRANATD